MSRRSYGTLMLLPAWLLYDRETLVASVRCCTAEEARELFKAARLDGTHLTTRYRPRPQTPSARS